MYGLTTFQDEETIDRKSSAKVWAELDGEFVLQINEDFWVHGYPCG